MKNLRRILTAVLALACSMLPLTACKTASVEAQNVTLAPIATVAPTLTPVPTLEPTPEPTPEPTEEVIPDFTAGTTEGTEYESEFFRLGCKLDDTWVLATSDELAQMSGIAADTLENWNMPDAYIERIQSGTVMFELSAMANGGLQSITISVEDGSDLLTGESGMDISTLLQIAKKPILDMLEQSGMEVKSSENITVMIGETEQAAILFEAKYSDMSVYMLVFMLQRGTYLMSANLTSIGSDMTGDMLKTFYFMK